MKKRDLSGNVYLYQRFSSSKQEGNSSLFRQTEAQNHWLACHPKCQVMTIDDEPLIDAGISAFRGKNVKEGSLGRLVKAIESGLIEKGSIILVEHFSRLSRMDIAQTEDLILKIWRYGVSVMSVRGDNYYPPESRNKSKARISLIVEIESAHSDSKWRSDKVTSSWVRRRTNAKELGVPPKMRMPFWLDKEGKLNGYADIVRDIFKLHAEGLGQVIIERELRKKYGLVKPLKNANPTKINRIIQNEKCIGKVFGEKLFQSVISDEIFYNAQRICKERLFTSVRENRKWPLHGLVKCGHCGSGMSIQQTAKALPLLRCSKKQRSGGEYCGAPTTFPYVVAYHFFLYYVEPVFLSHMTDMKNNKQAEKEKSKLLHQIQVLNSSLAEANATYRERTQAGKKASSTLHIMDDLRDEIDENLGKLATVQGKIEFGNSMTSISKEIVKLSESDSKEYNLELNKLGFKIWSKDNVLLFGLDNEDKISSLKYLKYDRSTLSYKYSFSGNEKFYKTPKHCGEIPSKNWTVERLLNPKSSFEGTPQQLAILMDELKRYEGYVPSFNVSNKE